MSYATVAEMKQVGINADALTGLSDADLQQALDSASSVADGYLRSRYYLPIQSPYPDDLVLRVAEIGAFLALKARGFSPDANPEIRMGYKDAIDWLEGVSMNRIQPAITDSRPSSAAEPRIVSKASRGW